MNEQSIQRMATTISVGAAFFAALLGGMSTVKTVCHECLTAPSVAVCERRGGAIDVQLQSERIGGYIKEREFAGCYFYWHENDTGGD